MTIHYDHEEGQKLFRGVQREIALLPPKRMDVLLGRRRTSITYGKYYDDLEARFDPKKFDLAELSDRELPLHDTFFIGYQDEKGPYRENIARFDVRTEMGGMTFYRADDTRTIIQQVLHQFGLRLQELPHIPIFVTMSPTIFGFHYEKERVTPDMISQFQHSLLHDKKIAYLHDVIQTQLVNT